MVYTLDYVYYEDCMEKTETYSYTALDMYFIQTDRLYTKPLNSSTYSALRIDPSAHGRLAQAGFSKTLKEV